MMMQADSTDWEISFHSCLKTSTPPKKKKRTKLIPIKKWAFQASLARVEELQNIFMLLLRMSIHVSPCCKIFNNIYSRYSVGYHCK